MQTLQQARIHSAARPAACAPVRVALAPRRSALIARSQAPEIAPGGQVTSALMESMSTNIREALEAKKVQVTDVYGDGRHVSIDVVSEQFEGKSSMQRQRMVYKAIWLELQETVHAVDAMTTQTPAEAGL